VQPFYVPSGSMEPTLAIGDAVLAAKFPYGYTRYSMPFDYFFLGKSTTPPKALFGRLPKVGDVVVFRLPRDPKTTFVKRVIGLPGDRIQMREGRLWINGKELPLRKGALAENEDEAGETILMPTYIETLPNGREHRIFKKSFDPTPNYLGFDPNNTGVYVVPPDHVFMMGDNRDNSEDSRFAVEDGGVGYVPASNVVGRPFIVIGSVDFKAASSIFEWPLQFRFSRILHGIH
jgi:signal peptidase I